MTATSRLAEQLVHAAMRLHGKRLWESLASDDAVALEIPHHDEPLAACVCGQSGEEFGLVLFRDGLPGMDQLFDSIHIEDHMESSDQLSLLVSALRDIPPPLRGLLDEARWRGRRESLAPMLMVRRPGMQPRNPRKNEIRTMLYAVSAILAAEEEGDLHPYTYDAPGGVQLLRLSGAPHAPDYEIGATVLEVSREQTPKSLQLADANYRRDDSAWSIGAFTLPAKIEGDERSLRALLVVENDTGKVLHQDIVFGTEIEAAATSLLRFIAAKALLPREVFCLNSDLHELLHPALAMRDVNCRHEPDQPELEDIAASLSAHLAGMDAPMRSDELEDRARWQEAHDDLIRKMIAVEAKRRPNREHALARYFGTARRGEEMMETDDDAIFIPFSVWRLLLYRARAGSKTVLEETLKRRNLPREQRRIGDSMQAASPSIYRVETTEPPYTTLLDMLGGDRVHVHDAGLSQSASIGSLLPAVVFAMGPYTSLTLIGPPIAAMAADEAFQHLESQGIEVTAAGLAANPHFGGRLAEWMNRAPVHAPKLVNVDGDELMMHTADFEMHDANAAVEALAARPDIDYDEGAMSYVWLSDEGFGGRPGRILLGKIDPVDDHLVLECNSASRFERAQRFLQKIPGVRFVSVRTSEMDFTSDKDATPRDDLPGIDEQNSGVIEGDDLPPEVLEQMIAMFAKMQMQWLDTKIPAFGGQTPRATCATPEGRRQVSLMITTMPNPNSYIPVERHNQIRDDMLRELGLDTPGV